MKFLSSIFRGRPKSARVLEQHGTRPTYRRGQPGANEFVTVGGITFRPKS